MFLKPVYGLAKREEKAYQVSALMPKGSFVIGAAYIPNHSPSRKKKGVSFRYSHLGRFPTCMYSVTFHPFSIPSDQVALLPLP